MMASGQKRPISSSVGRYQADAGVRPSPVANDVQTPLPQEFTSSISAPSAGAPNGDPMPSAPVIQPPTQLPDGQGGAVPVPAPQLAPPSTVNPLPTDPGFPGMTTPPNPNPLPGGTGYPGAPPPNPNPLPGSPPLGGGITTPPTNPVFNTGSGPAAAGGAGGTFGPDSNLINSQIDPTNDPRTMKLQGMQDSSLDKILNGPDRYAMAKDRYDTFTAATDPSYQHAITDATDAAAAHGQIRGGQLTNRYGDLSRQRTLDLTTAKDTFLQNALEGSIGDTQRGFEDASGAASTAYGQGAAGRNELRGERGYQSSQAQQALINRILQYQAEQGAQGQDFAQGAELYGAGNQGDPYGAYAAASGQAQNEAQSSTSDIGALLQALARRRASSGAAA